MQLLLHSQEADLYYGGRRGEKGLGFGNSIHSWPGVRHGTVNEGINWKSLFGMGRFLKAFPS